MVSYVEWARDMGRSRLSVLESDVGAVADFTGFPIIDIGGLANLHVARFKYYAPFLLQYVFDEEQPDVIHLQSGWARNAGIPLGVISRDYMQLDAPNGVPYAEGFFLRKDLYFASLARKVKNEGAVSRASQVATAAEALSAAERSLTGASHDVTIASFRRLNELCDEDETLCADAPALSRRARSLADAARSQLDFRTAFRLYAAAVFADPRDIVSLRPFPLVPDWRVGELAWEVFRTPRGGPFTLYAGVATGDDLGPAHALGSVGGPASSKR